jgi:NTE family protein
MSIDGKTVGVALSGGGYRASLFGLGSLWRLNDAGILGQVDRITSVSGGSILSGVVAHRWSRLQFTHGRAANFVQEIVEPVQAFCAHTIDIGVGLKGILTPFKSAGDYLIDTYEKKLFGQTTLKDLPAPGPGVPLFTFYATSLQTGRSFRFRQDKIADYLLGESRTLAVPLATAVAASSAFPPVFSPIILETDPAGWTSTDLTLRDAALVQRLRARVALGDGGIYDNMGLEQLVGTSASNADIVLVSDAGAPFTLEEKPHEDYALQLGRVRDILIDQTRALRKRWLIDAFVAGRKRGAYWGVATKIDDFAAPAALVKDSPVTDKLDEVATRLAGFAPDLQGRLINWGYVLCDAALRTRAGFGIPAAEGLPLPQWPLQ